MGTMIDRVLKELTAEDIAKISETYHHWQKDDGYEDHAGYCKSVTLEEVASHGYVLTPGRYVGAADVEDEGEPFDEKLARLTTQLAGQQKESAVLDAAIARNLAHIGYTLPESPDAQN